MTAVPSSDRVAEIEAALRARVQRTLGRRIGAPATQLTADLFQPGAGPLAPLLAAVREQADAIGRARALADERESDGRRLAAHPDPYEAGRGDMALITADRLRAVLPADHGQPTEGRNRR